MKRVTSLLLAASGLAMVASPALAQDSYTLPPPPPPVVYQPAPVQQAPAVMPVQTYPAAPMPQVQYQGQYEGQVQAIGPVRQYGYGAVQYPQPAPQYAPPVTQYPAEYPAQTGLPPVPTVGYTLQQREAWLADCRRRYYGEKKKSGGLIGGLLGAIGGGIAGHEVTNGSSHRRLGGTLIGAGVGGLLGAAIGSAIGAASDRDDIDECEAYLNNYTGGYGPGPAYGPYGYGYTGYVTVMVPVATQATYTYSAPTRRETQYVTEEIVEEKVVVPQTKYVRTAPATKTTKYTKSTK
ncbi:hypothetical protein GRI89_13260 [Altererythrobacter salegens]|uniref:17 kDa surface antigen n=1 Tax=Croceibacterium salegens TaxID=1737568 RepID=A0A6I4SYL7_9SPHN|nr:hypothetical protein [Croceibacterium salegens]MXO60508.1 hypothetical protein [Croceibacterium salegens]